VFVAVKLRLNSRKSGATAVPPPSANIAEAETARVCDRYTRSALAHRVETHSAKAAAEPKRRLLMMFMTRTPPGA